jgi:hypothetical protein
MGRGILIMINQISGTDKLAEVRTVERTSLAEDKKALDLKVAAGPKSQSNSGLQVISNFISTFVLH